MGMIITTFLRKRNCMQALKHAVDKYSQRSLSPEVLPKDVKEGHFAVLAVDINGCPKRFAIELRYLNHPQFLKLLDQAAEEFGFHQKGVLAIPCTPFELERFLGVTCSSKKGV